MNNKIREALLDRVCGVTSVFPEYPCAEAAFAGKSNVGKSSLINSLLQRKSLARTSSQPGKTRTINFYRVNPGESRPDFAPDTCLVDLPGYGYASVSKEAKADWGRMIERYLRGSGNLRLIFLLVDSRHKPGANDIEMHRWIVGRGFRPAIIATKKDKLRKTELERNISVIRRTLELLPGTPVIPFSAMDGTGRDEVWDLIRKEELPWHS